MVTNKTEIIRRLHEIVDDRLFGSGPWMVDRASADALKLALLKMGLEEQVPGETNTWQFTALGTELHVDLLLVFMGCWDAWAIPEILEGYGLVDKQDVHRLWRVLSRGGPWERTFKKSVRRAYFAFYNSSDSIN